MAHIFHCFSTACRENCEFCNNKGDIVLSESADNLVCPNNEAEKLKEMGETTTPTIINGKMNNAQIKADRRARSKNHFQKEVMPYLPKADQRMFAQRGYKNK